MGFWILVIFLVFVALFVLSFSFKFFYERDWAPGTTMGIVGIFLLSAGGAMLYSAHEGDPELELATGGYEVAVCARRGKTQHCLLDAIDHAKSVRYYSFPAAMETACRHIRDRGTYPPRTVIDVYEMDGKKFVRPTDLWVDSLIRRGFLSASGKIEEGC